VVHLGTEHPADQLAAQAVAITQELLPVLERTTVYAWRRHLATEVGRALLPAVAGLDNQVDTRPAAVGFIDISGFTRLSRNVDLTELAAVLERFETLVLDTVVAHGGRVIKNLGDEVLFVTDDPTAAAEATLGLLEVITAEEDLPRVHAGLAFGPVLYRGGDVSAPW
jgi:adenylate cyclase